MAHIIYTFDGRNGAGVRGGGSGVRVRRLTYSCPRLGQLLFERLVLLVQLEPDAVTALQVAVGVLKDSTQQYCIG